MSLKTVNVPAELEPAFAKAEEAVAAYFGARRDDPSRGTIEIHGERYVLVRAAALSVEFFGLVRTLYGTRSRQEADDFARNILFDLAHLIGLSDAKRFHETMGLADPIERLSAGPVHFAHAGWAFVDVSADSRPTPDENFYLLFDHPYSFEAAAWLAEGGAAGFPVCIMNAGYSSGWCEASFGVPLVASEILCRARGDDVCRFIMAPPDRIGEHLDRYAADHPRLADRVRAGDVPDLFARKRIEEELRRSETALRERMKELTCLCQLNRIVERPGATLETIFEEAARIIPAGWTHAEVACAHVSFNGRFYGDPPCHAGHANLRADIVVRGIARGYVGVCYREPRPEADEGPFLEEERALLNTLAGRLGAVAERRALQADLAQAQKLESIGQLAAGIAHEINTPTQFVGDNVRFLQDAFADLARLAKTQAAAIAAARDGAAGADLMERACAVARDVDLPYLLDEVPQAIEQSLDGLDRITKIVRAMKTFSHPGTEEKTPTDVNAAIESTVTVSRNEWKYVADLATDLDPDLPPIPCHPGDLNQVFLNLIVNAAHAIGDVVGDGAARGAITIRTRALEDGVEIVVTDTGAGIPEHVREKIFDPFFTTKEVGKGTGQGLAIARSVVVEKHGGAIAVDSEPGRGTTFTIRLPLADETAGNTGATSAEPPGGAAQVACNMGETGP